MSQQTCPWSQGHSLLQEYHDTEWGVPVHSDRKHFEFFVLDLFQAGLSWLTILKKREGFRKALDDFDVNVIAGYAEEKVEKLLQDESIIRNRLKIRATISNAILFQQIQVEFGSFDKYIWKFTGGETIRNRWDAQEQLPVSTKESDAMSKDLKKRGFTFVGTTICYSYMQAAGLVNDHITSCFRYNQV